MKISAVISTWNKCDAVLANVAALKAGRRVPDEIVVVDNASSDRTVEALATQHPDVVVLQMAHDRYGACETFNLGFSRATGDVIAIMDDDVEATVDWLAVLEETLDHEPGTTALVSSRVIEPGMPDAYCEAEVQRGPYYASTFRGCGTLARTEVLRACGGYDELFFIYGNERDLSARVLAAGYRILQTPEAVIHHSTPFGMKAGKRSLYYHVRNFWLYAFKYVPVGTLLRSVIGLARKALGGGGQAVAGNATGAETESEMEATGTMGLSTAVRETPGARWIVVKATLSALWHLPYCLARRQAVRSSDFKVPGV